MKDIRIKFGNNSCRIIVKSQLSDKLNYYLRKVLARSDHEINRCVVVTDNNVKKLYGGHVGRELNSAGIKEDIFSFPAGEKSKEFGTVEKIHHFLAGGKSGFAADRGTVIIAMGGGVVGDVAGFAAATYMRGLPLVQLPTSLIAQVDASIGGKTGVNLPEGKNLIGSFYQPLGVLIDPIFLETLPKNEFMSGIGEMIKYSFILPDPLYGIMRFHSGDILGRKSKTLGEAVMLCAEIKADIVEQDEKDRDIRMILNFGHTFGHALEARHGYSGISHGIAVMAGMCFALHVSEQEKILFEPGMFDEMVKLIELYGIRQYTKTIMGGAREVDALADYIKKDKKNSFSRIKMVVPVNLGEFDIKPFTARRIKKHIRSFFRSDLFKVLCGR